MEEKKDDRTIDDILEGVEYHIEIDEDGVPYHVVDNMTYEEFIEYIESKGCINIKDVKW